MKKTKQFLCMLVAAAMALSCLSLTAAADGPPTYDQTVELRAGAEFTCDDITLTLNDAQGTSLTIAKGGVSVQCASAYTESTKAGYGGLAGLVTVSQLTVTEVGEELLAIMPFTWKDSHQIILNQDGTFAADLDLNMAVMAYTAVSEKSEASSTGYTTTLTVEDPDKECGVVYAYGMWIAMDAEGNTYEPEQWENGLFYGGYGLREMSYDAAAGCWKLRLDLASASMPIQCYRDVSAADFAADMTLGDGCVVDTPYDAEKQSKSFDWGVTKANEKAGEITSVTIDNGIQLAIYTPYGYDAADTETRYQVLYLIPGMMTQYDSWFTGGLANVVFDNLIASGAIEPTILVTMTRDTARMDYNDIWDSADDRSKENGDGDGYINYVDGAEKGSGTENMIHSPVVTTVIPYIDANYNTYADAEHRAIAGTSMGSVATTQIWMTDPGLFSAYGFFSGADMWFNYTAKGAEYQALHDTYAADYEALLENAVATAKASNTTLVMGGGVTDRNAYTGDQNSAGADNLDAFMTEQGLAHTFSVVGGGHDWVAWTQLLVQFAGLWSGNGSAPETEPSAASEPSPASEAVAAGGGGSLAIPVAVVAVVIVAAAGAAVLAKKKQKN